MSWDNGYSQVPISNWSSLTGAVPPYSSLPSSGYNQMPPSAYPNAQAHCGYPQTAYNPAVPHGYADAAPGYGSGHPGGPPPAPSGGGGATRQCQHCGATSTPLWRRDPQTHATLCNACGLYLQQRHAPRPAEVIDAGEMELSDDDGNECAHCHTRKTSVWRRNKRGDLVCNACGVYERHHGVPRPVELMGGKIKRRVKNPLS
ncbi:unnamed protein product [Mycena citricolor]|uniref:GATA-type domain-containing protein n=1 Tax=Mycena citricolor TaxID=2018698 RepID=A0AAD2JXW3_9AGAR|nr:unnamed protein product [Mycena citricolor]